MSLATRCPSCGTAFRVVQDQLKVSEGWVRCGNCQDVFNALESLFDLEPEARHKVSVPVPPEPPAPAINASTHDAAAPLPPAIDPVDDQPAQGQEAAAWPVPIDEGRQPDNWAEPAAPAVEDFWAPVTAPEATSVEVAVAELPPQEQPVDVNLPEAAQTLAVATAQVEPTPETAPDPLATALEPPAVDPELAGPAPSIQPTPAWTGIRRRRGPGRSLGRPPAPRPLQSGETTQPSLFASESLLPPTGVAPPEDADPAPHALAAPPAPAFVRRAERAARWQSPAWRAGLGAAASLLTLALALQVGFFYRDALASHWPPLQAPLLALCQPMGCTLGAPHDIDSLVLDNSRLARTAQPEVLQLVAELHNRSGRAVRKPALDVSFTDASGQQVARKVFMAGELGASNDRIEANAPWTVDIRLLTPSLAITGFTMEVFYP